MAQCWLALLLLLSAAGAIAGKAHADIAVEAIFDRMRQQSITGATIITHGFTATDGGGGYMLPMAESIRQQLLTQEVSDVWLLDYGLADDGATGVFEMATSVLPAAGSNGLSGHAILLYDWGPESNEDTRWWAESAGDALFSLGTGLGIFGPSTKTSPPVQFIGHSFGSVVTSEAVERLAGYEVPVAQVTLIDPHDFDQADVPVFDDAQRLFELGAPNGYGATLWRNVAEADVYYQTRGNQGGLAGLVTADPEGRPIPGAYNRHLDGAEELPAGNPYGIFSTQSDHGYAWNTFYQASITGSLPSGADPPANAALDFAQTGWAHSIHNTNRVFIPAPNFFDIDQDHEHSDPKLVDPDTGNPNVAGLDALGLTVSAVTNARWDPEFRPGDIVNGDFEAGARTSLAVDIVAGWSHHGGGGDSEILTESTPQGENRYLQLDGNDPSRTHNFLYIPQNTASLRFDMRVANASGDDIADVFLADTLLAAFDLSDIGEWLNYALEVPFDLRNSSSTLSLAISFGSDGFDSPAVDFDNFSFDLADLLGDFNVDGIVNAADYTVWRNNVGAPFGTLPNDINGGTVGPAQYATWKANFGNTHSSSSSATSGVVPEPASALLLIIASLAVRLYLRNSC